MQTPIYHCVKEGPSKRFVPKRCAHLAKPILSDSVLKCNTQPCPAYWKISEWSSCQCTGNNDTGFQKREIKCVQELGTGMVIQIPNGACLDDKPDGRQLCECIRNKHDTYKYRVHSIKHRGHHSKIAVLNDDYNNNLTHRPDSIQKNKKSGVWLSSEWIEQVTQGKSVLYKFYLIFVSIYSAHHNVEKVFNTVQYFAIVLLQILIDVTSVLRPTQQDNAQQWINVMLETGLLDHGISVPAIVLT